MRESSLVIALPVQRTNTTGKEQRSGDKTGEGQDGQAPFGYSWNSGRTILAIDSAVTGVAVASAHGVAHAIARASCRCLAERAGRVVIVIWRTEAAVCADESNVAGARAAIANAMSVAVARAAPGQCRGTCGMERPENKQYDDELLLHNHSSKKTL